MRRVLPVLLIFVALGGWVIADDMAHKTTLRVKKSVDPTRPPYSLDPDWVVIPRSEYDRISAIPQRHRKADPVLIVVEKDAGEKASADTDATNKRNMDMLLPAMQALEVAKDAKQALQSAGGKDLTEINARIAVFQADVDALLAALP